MDLVKGAWKWRGGEGGPRVRLHVLALYLTTLFNRMFAETYPDSWNEQRLTSIYKGDPSDPANYRPIQYKLAAFIHACFELWNTDAPQPTQTS